MGSKFSQKKDEEKTLEKNNNNNNNIKFNVEPDDISISLRTNEYTDKSSQTTTTEVLDVDNRKFPYKFEWKGEAKDVILTGDFDNWQTKIIMKKNEKTGYFEAIVPLERKKNNFKFIVDGIWACSDLYPSNHDKAGNLNNFVTLENYYPPKDLFQKSENVSNVENTTNINDNNSTNKEENNKSLSIIKKEELKKKQYNCRYPLNDELNSNAPVIMWHYKSIYNLNYPSNQERIALEEKNKKNKKLSLNFENEEKEKKNLEYKEKNFYNENNTYKKIMTCPHEKLMHFCTNIEDFKNANSINFFKICTTIRTKHKFLTLIYFKPK